MNYIGAYVVFDDYSHISAKTRSHKRYKVDDTTGFEDFKDFLSTTITKDQLTLYLAKKITNTSQSPVVTVTRAGVTYSHLYQSGSVKDLGDNHEEAETKMVLYPPEIHKDGPQIHIYSSDTDVLVLALSVFRHLESEASLIMGTGKKCRLIKLKSNFLPTWLPKSKSVAWISCPYWM